MSRKQDKRIFYIDRVRGLYLTLGQLTFLRNIMFSTSPYSIADYNAYVAQCALYNKVSDAYKEDGASCSFFWDDEDSSLFFKYPKEGKVSSIITNFSAL